MIFRKSIAVAGLYDILPCKVCFVLIHDEHFIDKIYDIYCDTHFHVLGPDIYSTKTALHQNPIREHGLTKEQTKKLCLKYKILSMFYPIYYLYICFIMLKRLLLDNNDNVEEQGCSDINTRIENPVLIGACVIFSKDFIIKEDMAFNSHTFLYVEEDILHAECSKKGYHMLYDPKIKVNHLENVSTNESYKFRYKKLRMKVKNLKKSYGVLYTVLTGTD